MEAGGGGGGGSEGVGARGWGVGGEGHWVKLNEKTTLDRPERGTTTTTFGESWKWPKLLTIIFSACNFRQSLKNKKTSLPLSLKINREKKKLH